MSSAAMHSTENLRLQRSEISIHSKAIKMCEFALVDVCTCMHMHGVEDCQDICNLDHVYGLNMMRANDHRMVVESSVHDKIELLMAWLGAIL